MIQRLIGAVTDTWVPGICFRRLSSGRAMPICNFRYSYRCATIGSARIARRAGIQNASNATPSRIKGITMRIGRPIALTP
jgi:hypothetical protein